MLRPLIHIGYQKTGSSWLQQFLFTAPAGFAGVAKPAIREALIKPHALDFDADRARRAIDDAAPEGAGEGLVLALSAERLSGSPHSGGYDAKEMAGRVHALYPDGRVLIVIREQRAMIASSYRQYVDFGGVLPPERYLRPPESGSTRIPLFEPAQFAYDRLIGHYQELFGGDSALVLPYEAFGEAPEDFCRRIVEFAGATAEEGALASLPFDRQRNVSPGDDVLAVRRRLNRVAADDRVNPSARIEGEGPSRRVERLAERAGALLPGGAGRRFASRIERAVDALAGGIYRDSNRATQRLTGLDLARYGYDV